MVEVGRGVLVGPPGVTEGTTEVGVLVGPPGVLVRVAVLVTPGGDVLLGAGVLVRVAVLVGGTVVAAVVGVAVLHTGGEKVSFCPADRVDAVLHSYWVKVPPAPVPLCTPTVALVP